MTRRVRNFKRKTEYPPSKGLDGKPKTTKQLTAVVDYSFDGLHFYFLGDFIENTNV